MVMFVQSYRKAGNNTAYYDAVVADGATAYWRLDESSGNFVDSIGGHTMTVSDVTYGADALITDGGSAATFDGVNDYATATNHADLRPAAGEDFSIECWIKAPNKVQLGPLVYMRNASSPYPAFGLYIGYLQSGAFSSSRHISFIAWDSSSRRRSYRTTNNIIPNSDPVTIHLVGVYDNTNDAIKIYVDGSSEALTLSDTLNGFPDGPGTATDPLHMGNILTYYYEGDLDAVSVYDDVALSAAQVSDHYTKGST